MLLSIQSASSVSFIAPISSQSPMSCNYRPTSPFPTFHPHDLGTLRNWMQLLHARFLQNGNHSSLNLLFQLASDGILFITLSCFHYTQFSLPINTTMWARTAIVYYRLNYADSVLYAKLQSMVDFTYLKTLCQTTCLVLSLTVYSTPSEFSFFTGRRSDFTSTSKLLF